MLPLSDQKTNSAALTDVKLELADRVRSIFAASESGLRRIAVRVPDVDPFHWLDTQKASNRIFWSGRDDSQWTAAVGIADERFGTHSDDLEATLDGLARNLENDPSARYFGGISFDNAHTDNGDWRDFGAYRFVLPRFELFREGDQTMLACSIVLPSDIDNKDRILEEIESLTFPELPLEATLAAPIARQDEPDRNVWEKQIDGLLESFRQNELQKVVLARKVGFTFEDDLSALRLIKRLFLSKPGCFHFLFQAGPESTFVSASPERLYYRKGRRIQSEAVAGTLPRDTENFTGADPAQRLLSSEKDQREHAFVRESIGHALVELCNRLEVQSDATVMTLSRRIHLVSRISGLLREGVQDADLLRRMHPTPAVGGFPTSDALERIRQLESFDRGWYAGPIGWIGANGAEFAVGIRSGLISGNKLDLFSGAGIVQGSTAMGEWQEIEEKLSDFLEVLGLEC